MGRRWAGDGGRGAGGRGRGWGVGAQGRGGGGGRGPPGPLGGDEGDPGKARDLPSLAALVQEGAAGWSVSRLCAAFNRAGKLSSPAVDVHATASDDPRRADLLHCTLAALATADLPLVPGLRDAKWCVIPLWACAKAGYWSGGLASTLLQRLGQDGGALMRQATDQGHGNVWWSVSEAPEGVLTTGQTEGVLHASIEGLLQMGARSIGTQECSNVLLASARLGFVNPVLLHHLTSCLAAQPDAINCQDLANSLYALGELREDCGHTPRPQDLQRLAAEVVWRLPFGLRQVGSLGQEGGDGMFIPKALSNMLLGCSKLGYADPDLLQPLAAAAGQAAVRMEEQGLANSLYSLAVLRCAGSAAYAPAVQCLTVEVQQRLQRQPDAFKPQHLSNILYALSVLDCKGPAYAPAVQCLTVEVQQRLQRQPDAFEPQSLSNMLYALAVLGCKDPAYAPAVQCLTVEVQQGLQWQPDAFEPQALSNILYALAVLGCKNPTCCAPVAALAAECKQRGFAGFSAQGLANSVWALARMGYDSDQAWFESAVAAAVQLDTAEVFSPQHVSNIWYALALVRHHPAAALLESTAAASDMLCTRATGQVCANLLWSLATLGVPYDPRLVGVLLERLRGEVNEQNLANSLWALAVMGPDVLSSHRCSVEGLLRELVRRWNEDEAGAIGGSGAVQFNTLELRQLWQVQQELVHTDGCAELAGILPADKGAGPQQSTLTNAMRCAAEGQVDADQRTSDLQRRVVRMLVRLQRQLASEQGQQQLAGAPCIVSVSGEQQVEGMVGRVDVVVELVGGRWVAMEVDGPTHFLSNDPHTRDRNGSTQLRDRQLGRLFGAGNVVSVPHWEWREMRGDVEREEGYLLRLLRGSGADGECEAAWAAGWLHVWAG
ncbi:hypothetical protein TSOC_009527 [Tetrabaena socialis]|uniref:RAP domain-containing protein n=1 Tax=Tetrabaena socialis TaxID=47790 RepID=A0A2J7ZVL7_9CHLO|nr:hypothetical protein TSOC_009527 [Tetrabaena socialis]|eukprot:PNH04316.1 hypothetical protein TSOC_009527 [Tetrabaena socialis]